MLSGVVFPSMKKLAISFLSCINEKTFLISDIFTSSSTLNDFGDILRLSLYIESSEFSQVGASVLVFSTLEALLKPPEKLGF